jgi:hypothetical protein
MQHRIKQSDLLHRSSLLRSWHTRRLSLYYSRPLLKVSSSLVEQAHRRLASHSRFARRSSLSTAAAPHRIAVHGDFPAMPHPAPVKQESGERAA